MKTIVLNLQSSKFVEFEPGGLPHRGGGHGQGRRQSIRPGTFVQACLRSIYTIPQIVWYDKNWIDPIRANCVILHFQMLHDKIFTNICRIV
jgi:hypothetical protein